MSSLQCFFNRPVIALLLLTAACVGSVHAQVAWYTETGTVVFTSSVPLHEFSGTSEHLTGQITPADSTVDFYLDLVTLRTGIGKRDKDMRETLNVDDHPFAEFYGKLTTPLNSESTAAQSATVKGEFRVNNQSKPVTISGTLQFRDSRLHLDASWELNLNDYGIEPPGLLIVKVDEIQKIRISAVLNRRNP